MNPESPDSESKLTNTMLYHGLIQNQSTGKWQGWQLLLKSGCGPTSFFPSPLAKKVLMSAYNVLDTKHTYYSVFNSPCKYVWLLESFANLSKAIKLVNNGSGSWTEVHAGFQAHNLNSNLTPSSMPLSFICAFFLTCFQFILSCFIVCIL